MASLKDIAAVKVAVELCNNTQLKIEILCFSDSEYEANKTGDVDERKEKWTEIVEQKAAIMVENLGLEKHLQEKVIGIVLCVGMRMLTWAEYHERTIGFSRTYSFNFLNSSFFSILGIVDCKKAAEVLMNDTSISVKQKFKLALYYMNEHISALYKQLTEEDKEEFYDSESPSRINQPCFVKFWSYFLKDELDKLRGDTKPSLYWLQMAVKSGSRNAVEYCLNQTDLITDKGALIYAALKAVRNRVAKAEDWIVFSDHESDTIESWVPNDYYTDIVSSLFSKMTENQRVEFLKEDIKSEYGITAEPIGNSMSSKVLECFMDWPYQDYFMKTARLMWEILPEISYAELLLNICLKIESDNDDFKYGEEKYYDYRKLLMEFWNESPQRNKRFVFRDNKIMRENGESWIFKSGKILLFDLFKLKNFTYEDRINIQIILACATNEEKDDIISSNIGTDICIELIEARRWLILDEFLSICYACKEKVKMFKRDFIFSEEVLHLSIGFIRIDDWKSFETLIRWSTLPTEEITQFKKKIICSKCARDIRVKLIAYDKKLADVEKVFS